MAKVVDWIMGMICFIFIFTSALMVPHRVREAKALCACSVDKYKGRGFESANEELNDAASHSENPCGFIDDDLSSTESLPAHLCLTDSLGGEFATDQVSGEEIPHTIPDSEFIHSSSVGFFEADLERS